MIVNLLIHEDCNCNHSTALSTGIGGKIETKVLLALEYTALLFHRTERTQGEKSQSSVRDKEPLYSSWVLMIY